MNKRWEESVQWRKKKGERGRKRAGDLSPCYSQGCKLSLLWVKAGNANDDKAFLG